MRFLSICYDIEKLVCIKQTSFSILLTFIISILQFFCFQVPMFHFNTDNIHEAYQFLKNKGIEIVNHLEDNGHYFTIKDPYGNILMICQI
ncbi:VOC family protein [Bacillus sp. Bva_UNVM-123]|uniref:VOC family protein n=1 Tax=Bacillus sp. Bva_UNVM-123 TaxID=2829798 RepID=UPI00391F06A0